MPTPPPTKRASTRITCAPHTAPILRAELQALGWGGERGSGTELQEEHPTYLQVGATLEQAMELALRLRTATHVMWQLARFRCPSPKALYTEIAAYPWEDLIPPPPHGYLTIRAHADTPTIDNQMYPALVAKDAICDRMTKKTGARPDAGPDRRGVVLSLYWKDDRAALFLNINAQSLANRGYRHLPGAAPMRETLAAAVLLAAGYDGTTPFVNPMCGSGTLAIEAALIATGRAPGLLRPDYAITKTNWDIEDLWQSVRRKVGRHSVPIPQVGRHSVPTPQVGRHSVPTSVDQHSMPTQVDRHSVPGRKSVGTECRPTIIATDHDPQAIFAAKKNAQAAGVDHLIRFIECDFRQTPIPVGRHSVPTPQVGRHSVPTPQVGRHSVPTSADQHSIHGEERVGTECRPTGHILLNPEYGERMGDEAELESTYAAIGDFFKQSCPGWTGHVFTGSPHLAKRIGLKPSRKQPFLNGTIECRLLTFDLYQGSKSSPVGGAERGGGEGGTAKP